MAEFIGFLTNWKYNQTTNVSLEPPPDPANLSVPGEQDSEMASVCDFSLLTMPNESAVYDALELFSSEYRQIHTYLSIFICIFGTVCNICNVVVLTRPSMRTAVNTILCAIAFCDMIVMVSNLVITCHFNLVARVQCRPEHWGHIWGILLSLHAQLTVIGHSSSIWLSVAMSYLRYSTLKPRAGQMVIRNPQTELAQSYVAIAIVISCVVVFNVPNCLSYNIQEIPLGGTGCQVREIDLNATAFVPVISPTALANNCLVFRLAYWISGLVFKMLPCILLTAFITLLVRILAEVKRRRQRLLEPARGSSIPNSGAPSNSQQAADRTTKMLITVICVFLATELPQGLMTVTTGMIGSEFRHHIYGNLGDVLDLLSLINSCMTFVIYCSMSKQYRAEFRRIFIAKKIRRMATKRLATARARQSAENSNATARMTLTSEDPSVFIRSPKLNNRIKLATSGDTSPPSTKGAKFLTVDYRPSERGKAEPLLANDKDLPMNDKITEESDNCVLDESQLETML